jgi:glutathione S-transferase
MRYELTDHEWAAIRPMLPNKPRGVPRVKYLSESVAICRYLEGLHPEPNLLGRDLREQAEVERWNRRMKLELFAPIGRTIQAIPQYGETQRAVVNQRL